MKKSSIDEPFIWEISREEEMKIREQMRVNEAKKEGIEEGIVKGIEEGKIQGIEENKKAIAKNMLELGLEEEIILKATGLSKEELEKLK